jgi:GTP pyrophosphokinase
MKSEATPLTLEPAAVVQLASEDARAALADDLSAQAQALERARLFAEPLLAGQLLDTGEAAMAHADGTAAVLRSIGAAPALCAAAYLVYAGDYLQRPEETLRKAFGENYAALVSLTRKLVQVQRAARAAPAGAATGAERAQQTERVRKMLLAFSRDLRVVLLRLASRLQTLRWHAASRSPCPAMLAQETMQVFAPLANRLGIGQIKWELEDLAFRFLQPDEYARIAGLVDEKRVEREQGVQAARELLQRQLHAAGIETQVLGRPKHLYSIWRKMQGKGLPFERVLDARALRVLVADVPACYAALARVHEAWQPVDGEFDDYIARPKPNGYQSLHTVVLGGDGRPLEVQIRTRAMHERAEHGVAAHWLYKEAGAKGYTGVAAAVGPFEDRVAEARKAVLRELLAWERDFASEEGGSLRHHGSPAAAADPSSQRPIFDDRIYVFTPHARIIELPRGGTPVDFAYSLHTDLGHRCRGARVDGRVVPLNTALGNGQTVELVTAKEGGPSLDWLKTEAGYLQSARARAKVRAWFNAQAQGQTIARGRELVEKLLQREGRTAQNLDELASRLGFDRADALFEVVGKEELSLRTIENLLRPVEPEPDDDRMLLHRSRSDAAAGGAGKGGVLVVGVDSLLTTLARCCRPAPPDEISGFVTRGRGVAIHRRDCSNLAHMVQSSPGRVIEVEWGSARPDQASLYPMDVLVEASDRPGLLRDIGEVFAKEKINVTGVNTQGTQSRRRTKGGGVERASVWITFTVETTSAARLGPVLQQLRRVAGIRHAKRK